MKKFLSVPLTLITCLVLFTGCGNAASESFVMADLSYTQSDVENIPISPDVQVVGLGEASHGVAQYHQMKVDNYINGSGGSAEEAVREIGFAIYRTQEMADLIEWMRSYNETVSPEEALHFCGMDMQRFVENLLLILQENVRIQFIHIVTYS